MVGRRPEIVWYARLGSRMRGDGKFRGGGIVGECRILNEANEFFLGLGVF